jgi:hypothetical protein
LNILSVRSMSRFGSGSDPAWIWTLVSEVWFARLRKLAWISWNDGRQEGTCAGVCVFVFYFFIYFFVEQIKNEKKRKKKSESKEKIKYYPVPALLYALCIRRRARVDSRQIKSRGKHVIRVTHRMPTLLH